MKIENMKVGQNYPLTICNQSKLGPSDLIMVLQHVHIFIYFHLKMYQHTRLSCMMYILKLDPGWVMNIF